MKIIVMGAGIIGVTTAYFLARQGHKVIVIEKNNSIANACSYANGSQLSFSHIEPFFSKSSSSLIAKALFLPNSFLKINDFISKDFSKFCFKFFKNCNEAKTIINSKKIFELGKESKKALEDLILEEENFDFNYSKKGILHFYRNPNLFHKAIKQAAFQEKIGDEVEIFSKNECISKEPTLVKLYDEDKLVGGIFHPQDASGDALLFAQNLAKICAEKYGVVFEFNAEIKNILTNHKKITGINTTKEVFVADLYICALGAYGNKLLKGINIETDIFPIKGHSLSIPANSEFIAPENALTDVENKIVYSRIGNIFRAAGAAEIGSIQEKINHGQIDFLKSKIRANFSDFGNIAKAQEWCGIRPMRANSIPLIGKVKKYGNLFLNMGHGHLGWTLSCGSAKILSDMIINHLDEKFAFLEDEFGN